jgi:hypothetical protein
LDITFIKTSKRQAQEIGASKSSARRVIQLLKLRTSKATAIKAFQPRHPPSGIQLFSWFLESVVLGEINSQFTFFSGEAWFYSQEFINMKIIPTEVTESTSNIGTLIHNIVPPIMQLFLSLVFFRTCFRPNGHHQVSQLCQNSSIVLNIHFSHHIKLQYFMIYNIACYNR